MEGSLASLNSSALEELSIPELEELASSDEPTPKASDEEDSGTASDEFGSAEELVCSRASDELSGSIPGLTPVAPVEESESLPQLAQKRPATDKQLNRKNLRIFIFPPFPIKYILFPEKSINNLF
jgi:hypothetical protein